MNIEDIEKAVAALSPTELAEFRAWFERFSTAQPEPKTGAAVTAEKLGRFAGRAFADVRKRIRDS